jgi:deoxyribonuclease-4
MIGSMFFGAHLSSSGGIYRAVERAVEIGADGVQVFTQSPRAWRPTNHSAESIERFRELRESHGLEGAVTHAIYLINIASDDRELNGKSTKTLVHTMEVAELLGLDSVIFHPGSHKGAVDGLSPKVIARIVKAIDKVLKKSDTTWLLLENSAGSGGTIGRDVDELARVVDAVDHPRLGICIDSCHWFASGTDVRDYATLDAALAEIDSSIGLDRLRALHLNDSKTRLGSNVDRHANIGEGEIGTKLATFLGHPKLQHLGCYLEVPGVGDGPTAEQIKKARATHKRGVANWRRRST